MGRHRDGQAGWSMLRGLAIAALALGVLWSAPVQAQEPSPGASADPTLAAAADPSPDASPAVSPAVSPDASPPGAVPSPGPLPIADLPPVDIQPALETGSAASATLQPDSEVTLTATDASGTTYTLIAPAGAVQVPTEITMTPISSAAGMPFASGLLAGVDLGPDGLAFMLPLRLEMRLADGALPEGIAPWDYLGDGKELALVLPEVIDGGLAYEIWHFSGVGASIATPSELSAQGRTQLSDFERAVQQAVAREAVSHAAWLTGRTLGVERRVRLQEAIDRYWDQALGRLWASATTCAARDEAVRQTAAADGVVQRAGGGRGVLMTRARAAERSARRACIEEIWKQCEVDHDMAAIPRFIALQRQISEILGEAMDLQPWVDGCARWEFKLDSTAKLEGKGKTGGQVTQENTGRGSVEFQGVPLGIGNGRPGPWPLDVAMSGSSFKLTGAKGCKMALDKDSVSGAKVETLSMTGRFETGPDGSVRTFVPQTVEVGFDPGSDDSEARFVCKVRGVSLDQAGASLKPWNQRWLVHIKEDGEGGGPLGFLAFRFTGGDVHPGQQYASRTYDRTAKIGGGAKLKENTTLELWHRPKRPAGP